MTPADDALAAALVAEHAAIYGYGSVGARLDSATVAELAQQPEAAHRARRDALLIRLASKGIAPPSAETAYALPFPVQNRDDALRLALTIEERTAAIWRLALPTTAGDERQICLDALVDCAVRAARVRRTVGVTPTIVPFPGTPA